MSKPRVFVHLPGPNALDKSLVLIHARNFLTATSVGVGVTKREVCASASVQKRHCSGKTTFSHCKLPRWMPLVAFWDMHL